MEFKEFIRRIEQSVKKECSEGEKAVIQQIEKNNGVTLTGISIAGNEASAPIMYLDHLFDEFKDYMGMLTDNTLELFSKRLVKQLREEANALNEQEVNDLLNFGTAKGKLSFRLVNRQKNKDLLEKVPYIPVLDLAMVFQICVRQDMAALINNTVMKNWGVSIEELYECAVVNAPKIAGAELTDIYKTIDELAGQAMMEVELSEDPKDIYVLTNQKRIYGAGVILYDGLLKRTAEQFGSDLVVIPSSVHEMLIMPFDEGSAIGDLDILISWVNSSKLKEEDVLSDRAYFYDRDAGILRMASPRKGEEQHEIKI